MDKQRIISAIVAIVVGLLASGLVSGSLNGQGPSAGFAGLGLYFLLMPAIVLISSLVSAFAGGTKAGKYAGYVVVFACSFIVGGFIF